MVQNITMIILILVYVILALILFNNPELKIVQIHKYKWDELPEPEKKAVLTWKKHTTDYIYFTNDEAYGYILDRFNKNTADAYKSIQIGAFKADFFRLCWIYKEGGIYADCDTECIIDDLQEWLESLGDTDVILTRDDPSDPSQFYQAFIYARFPGNKFIKMCIDKAIQNIEKYKTGVRFSSGHEFIGPKMLQHVMGNLTPIEPGSYKNHDTNFFILSWKNDVIVDNMGREIFKHKCQECENYINSPDYWANGLNEKIWVN